MRSELASREAECWEGFLLGYVVGGGRAEAPRWGRQKYWGASVTGVVGW